MSKPHPRDVLGQPQRTGDDYDYIIVGGGTAGCLLANRLSADPNVRVLMLEAGRQDDYHWVHIPVGYLHCIGNPRTDWLFETEPEAGLNGRKLRYPRGKVWGGCSSINGMIYMRGQAGDYDRWARDNPGWSWRDVLPWFLKHENWHGLDAGGEDLMHGHGGEWRIETQRLRWDILDAFREAAAQAGIPPVDDFNRGDNFGCGPFEVTQKRGVRWSAVKAFLYKALGRANFTLLSGAEVERITFTTGADGRPRAQGVIFTGGGQRWEARARHEVLLSAGAIGSPAILQRSGLGPRGWLGHAGIPVVAEVEGVGANLQDHLQIRCAFRVQGVETLNQLANSTWGKLKIGLEYALFRTGPMSMAPSQLGAFARSHPSVDRPDLQWHVQPLSLDKFGEPLHPFPAFTASVCHLRPESRGTVRIRSADPEHAPEIRPNYLSTPGDRQVAARAIRFTRHIASMPALAPFRPEEFRPGPQLQTDEDLARAAGEIGTTIFHPVGTARMGQACDRLAVVDHRLRMHAVDGLRVIDASVMPTITSGNTAAPTLMIAEKAAAMILEERRLGGRVDGASSADTALEAVPA